MSNLKRTVMIVAVSALVLGGGYFGYDAVASKTATECGCCACEVCNCAACECCQCGDACACDAK